jgi:hypothetical protein
VPFGPPNRKGVGDRFQPLSGIHNLHANGAQALRDRR